MSSPYLRGIRGGAGGVAGRGNKGYKKPTKSKSDNDREVEAISLTKVTGLAPKPRRVPTWAEPDEEVGACQILFTS